MAVVVSTLMMSFGAPAYADIAGDEDWTFYEVVVEDGFKAFHRKHGRYPRTWLELDVQDSCTGYYPAQKRNFPKSSEAIVWRPNGCTLAYKIQFADKRSFRVVALAKGQIVSINDTFRVTYLKTPYHSHEPPECPPQSAC